MPEPLVGSDLGRGLADSGVPRHATQGPDEDERPESDDGAVREHPAVAEFGA